jgi:hypothetical protein
MKKLVFAFLLVGILKCGFDRGCNIGVLNNSEHTIYVYDSFLDSLALYQINSIGNTYRTGFDTAYIFSNGVVSYSSNRAEPDSIAYVLFFGTHKSIFRQKECIDGKIRLFVFKEEAIRKYSWEEICEQQMYEKKLTLSEKDLRENDWTVVYE